MYMEKKKDQGDAQGPKGSYEDEVLDEVAGELLDAIGSKDKKALKEALRSFLMCIEAMEDDEDDGK